MVKERSLLRSGRGKEIALGLSPEGALGGRTSLCVPGRTGRANGPFLSHSFYYDRDAQLVRPAGAIKIWTPKSLEPAARRREECAAGAEIARAGTP